MVCRTSGKLWPAACSYMALKLKMVCPFTKHCGKESKGEKKKGSEGVCSKDHMQPTKPNLFIASPLQKMFFNVLFNPS